MSDALSRVLSRLHGEASTETLQPPQPTKQLRPRSASPRARSKSLGQQATSDASYGRGARTILHRPNGSLGYAEDGQQDGTQSTRSTASTPGAAPEDRDHQTISRAAALAALKQKRHTASDIPTGYALHHQQRSLPRTYPASPDTRTLVLPSTPNEAPSRRTTAASVTSGCQTPDMSLYTMQALSLPRSQPGYTGRTAFSPEAIGGQSPKQYSQLNEGSNVRSAEETTGTSLSPNTQTHLNMLEVLEVQLSARSTEATLLHQQLSNMEEANRKLHEELASSLAAKEDLEQQLASLVSFNKHLKMQLGCDEGTDRMEIVHQRLYNMEQEIKELTAQNRRLAAANDELSAQLVDQGWMATRDSTDLGKLHSVHAGAVKDQQQLQDHVRLLECQLATRAEELELLKTELAQAQHKEAAARTLLETQSRAEMSAVERLRQQLAEVLGNNDLLSSQLVKLQRDTQQLYQKKLERDQQVMSMKKVMKQLRDKVELYEKDLKGNEDNKASLAQRLQALRLRNQALEKALEKEQSTRAKSEKQAAMLEEEVQLMVGMIKKDAEVLELLEFVHVEKTVAHMDCQQHHQPQYERQEAPAKAPAHQEQLDEQQRDQQRTYHQLQDTSASPSMPGVMETEYYSPMKTSPRSAAMQLTPMSMPLSRAKDQQRQHGPPSTLPPPPNTTLTPAVPSKPQQGPAKAGARSRSQTPPPAAHAATSKVPSARAGRTPVSPILGARKGARQAQDSGRASVDSTASAESGYSHRTIAIAAAAAAAVGGVATHAATGMPFPSGSHEVHMAGSSPAIKTKGPRVRTTDSGAQGGMSDYPDVSVTTLVPGVSAAVNRSNQQSRNDEVIGGDAVCYAALGPCSSGQPMQRMRGQGKSGSSPWYPAAVNSHYDTSPQISHHRSRTGGLADDSSTRRSRSNSPTARPPGAGPAGVRWPPDVDESMLMASPLKDDTAMYLHPASVSHLMEVTVPGTAGAAGAPAPAHDSPPIASTQATSTVRDTTDAAHPPQSPNSQVPVSPGKQGSVTCPGQQLPGSPQAMIQLRMEEAQQTIASLNGILSKYRKSPGKGTADPVRPSRGSPHKVGIRSLSCSPSKQQKAASPYKREAEQAHHRNNGMQSPGRAAAAASAMATAAAALSYDTAMNVPSEGVGQAVNTTVQPGAVAGGTGTHWTVLRPSVAEVVALLEQQSLQSESVTSLPGDRVDSAETAGLDTSNVRASATEQAAAAMAAAIAITTSGKHTLTTAMAGDGSACGLAPQLTSAVHAPAVPHANSIESERGSSTDGGRADLSSLLALLASPAPAASSATQANTGEQQQQQPQPQLQKAVQETPPKSTTTTSAAVRHLHSPAPLSILDQQGAAPLSPGPGFASLLSKQRPPSPTIKPLSLSDVLRK